MRLIYLAVFSLFLMVTSCAPTHANAVVCQNKTQVAYSNGVFNSRDEAELSRKFLEVSLSVRPQFNEFVDLAYANDGGAAFTLSGALPSMGQLLELYLQKQLVDNTSNFWHWSSATGSVPAPQWFLNGMKQIAVATNAVNYVFDGDLRSYVSAYTGYLKAGNKVLIVSHSQGNFYSNAAHRLLTQAGFGNNVGIVAVATPAGVVEGGGPHITASEDLVIKAVRILSFGLGVLPANAVNTTRPVNADPFNHNFIKFYMAGTKTRILIIFDIVQTIGKLQYPAQVCTPPVAGPVATVPQPGPYYFRDDWGALTFDLSVLEYRGYFYRKDPWGRFKNLRDEQKGLAYHVDMKFTLVNPGTKTWDFPMKTSMTITDYTSMAQQTIPLTFTGQFHPQDVLLWNGGLIFLSFDKRNNNWIGNYHRDDIVRVNWRKVSIVDNGAGVANRWALKPVQSGIFTMPNYTVTRKTWTTTPTGSAQKWGVGSNNQWNKLGVAFRDAMTYTYRIPLSAAEAHWTDAPSTPFGWVNGGNVAPPNPPLKNYLGEYGVLEVIDGVLSFTSLGKAPLQSTDVQQSGQVPTINSFGGIEQTVAYQNTQGIVSKAMSVDEASQPNWKMAGTPPVVGAPALGSLKAALPANELFFNPRTWTQNFQYAYGTYGQIFIPFSLSKQMAASFAIGINNTPLFSQRTAVYKLGAGFSFPYLAPTPSNIPRFLRRGVHTCAATVSGCTFGKIYGVSVNTAQKAFLMSPTP